LSFVPTWFVRNFACLARSASKLLSSSSAINPTLLGGLIPNGIVRFPHGIPERPISLMPQRLPQSAFRFPCSSLRGVECHNSSGAQHRARSGDDSKVIGSANRCRKDAIAIAPERTEEHARCSSIVTPLPVCVIESCADVPTCRTQIGCKLSESLHW
jgi:hypothetical protein